MLTDMLENYVLFLELNLSKSTIKENKEIKVKKNTKKISA